jgi:hypothetical protein
MRRLIVTALAAASVSGAVAVAASGGSSNAIHACYSKHTGALRMLTKGKCGHSERATSWNQRGLSGPAGRNGVNGTNGTNGTDGAPGTARAYAHVQGSVSTPSFVAAQTKGFSAVAEPFQGVYCLTAPGIDPTKTAAAVTAVTNPAFAGVPTYAKLDSPNITGVCPSTQFEVRTVSLHETVSGGYVTSVSEVASPNLDLTIVVP